MCHVVNDADDDDDHNDANVDYDADNDDGANDVDDAAGGNYDADYATVAADVDGNKKTKKIPAANSSHSNEQKEFSIKETIWRRILLSSPSPTMGLKTWTIFGASKMSSDKMRFLQSWNPKGFPDFGVSHGHKKFGLSQNEKWKKVLVYLGLGRLIVWRNGSYDPNETLTSYQRS